MTKFKRCSLKYTAAAITNVTILALLAVMTVGSSLAFAQVGPPLDPSFEVFRIRCQIDEDLNAVTGLIEPKVQIQAKVRADLLDGFVVGIVVENISRLISPLPPNVVNVAFELGSASAECGIPFRIQALSSSLFRRLSMVDL